tara:strand:- start:597 stop:1139 length:543 start_codon:yes stop_codon:yes gene_type:complete
MSCTQSRKKHIEISDEFKLEFLNEILSDTSNLKIISNKEQLITFGELIPGMMPIHPNGGSTISHFEFIADSLETQDIDFIRQQWIKNKDFDFMQLKNYGFRVFDLQKLRQETKSSDLFDTLEIMNKGFKSFYRTIITVPVFNEKKDKAYLMVNNYGGAAYILKMENGKWEVKSKIHEYVE